MTQAERAREELKKRAGARGSYAEYLAYVHGAGWKRTAMAEYLAGEVQAFLEEDSGHAYDILLIAAPPQHGKSLCISASLPSWYLMKHPTARVILASYNDSGAERFCRRNAEKLRRFGPTLGGVRLGRLCRAGEFELDNGVGGMIARGLMAGITGHAAELVIIDDPIKNRAEADSPRYRARVWEEWQNTLKSRLAAGAKVIVIMTPWHEDDLRGRLLAGERHLRYLRLPVAAEEHDPLGRAVGEPLCPELGKDKAWLTEFRDSYCRDPLGGSRAWQALYQCAPRTEEGQLVRRDWWKSYDRGSVGDFDAEVISVDCAFKGTERSDYVAITVWGKKAGNYYLRDCVNRQLNFSETLRAIREVQRRYPTARRVLVEDKANGPAVIDVLGRELLCVPVTPRGGKVARVNAVSAAIEGGRVFLPRDAAWREAYIQQWCAFPHGGHDDMVDSSTQALQFLLFAGGESCWSRDGDAAALSGGAPYGFDG